VFIAGISPLCELFILCYVMAEHAMLSLTNIMSN
jgi:hypothetical protein